MYIKAPLVVLLFSAIPSLALPVASDSVTARFASSDSSLDTRQLSTDGCINKAKRTCDKVDDPDCINLAIRACDKKRGEEFAKRACDSPDGCIYKRDEAERRACDAVDGCINKRETKASVERRTCDPAADPGCINPGEEAEAVNKRTCDSADGCINEREEAEKRACDSTDGCINATPPRDNQVDVGCINKKGKRTCDRL
jgi:hypothetical protein